MAKGKRKTIILNSDNPKEKLILDLLEQQYNASEFIKDLLFNNILHDGNTIITPLSHNDNSMTNVLPYIDNTIINQLSSNDNTITTQLSHDGNSKFQIDLNKVSDVDVEINASVLEDPNQNALDFLKNGF